MNEDTEPKYDISDELIDRLNVNFTYHPPKDGQPDRYNIIRNVGRSLAFTICDNCPPSRELSLALTNLEQAIMWANAAIARNE